MELMDQLQEMMEHARVENLRFPRQSFFIAASVLAWVVFWELAERHQRSPYTQTMAWLFVFVAIWLACTY